MAETPDYVTITIDKPKSQALETIPSTELAEMGIEPLMGDANQLFCLRNSEIGNEDIKKRLAEVLPELEIRVQSGI